MEKWLPSEVPLASQEGLYSMQLVRPRRK